MLKKEIFLRKAFKWAPEMDDEAWALWAKGERKIPFSHAKPAIDYLPSKSLRRMNQMILMTVHALHGVLPLSEETPIFFHSTIGEADQQFLLEKEFHLEKEIHPASFSYSVFNAPIAMATILLGQKNPYSCLFAKEGEVKSGFLTALAPILSGRSEEVIFLACEEAIPFEYVAIHEGGENEPFVYALVLTSGQTDKPIDESFLSSLTSEEELVKSLIRKGWI